MTNLAAPFFRAMRSFFYTEEGEMTPALVIHRIQLACGDLLSPTGKQSFLQFQTSYMHPSGRRRLRVTTLSYRFADQSPLDIAPGK